ncbi:MAG: Sporulation domain protein [Magnetococcales bacterium]|nr:Sporulation domain protein [Magnetococcales bacterium]HIJ85854.1 AAA family ATPase [Magnetococcales bacterium]
MYLEYFKFEKLPFSITPDADFFYPGRGRGAILDTLEQAVLDAEGIVKVVGEVGTGKTTLCRILCQRLPQRVHSALLLNSRIAPDELHDAILTELKQKPIPGAGSHERRQQLQNHLIHLFAEGGQGVLLVEEAQSMRMETFEELRFLNNIETDNHKMLQIILFGQPELDHVLKRPSLRHIRDRISRHITIPLFTLEDTACYIQSRLDRASGREAVPLFSKDAVAKIHKMAHGSLRRVNILAHHALIHAFQEHVAKVEKKHVRPRRRVRYPRFSSWNRLVAHTAKTFTRFNSLRPRTIRIRYPEPLAATVGSMLLILIAGMLPFWLSDRLATAAGEETDRSQESALVRKSEAGDHDGESFNTDVNKNPPLVNPLKKNKKKPPVLQAAVDMRDEKGTVSIPILSIASWVPSHKQNPVSNVKAPN